MLGSFTAIDESRKPLSTNHSLCSCFSFSYGTSSGYERRNPSNELSAIPSLNRRSNPRFTYRWMVILDTPRLAATSVAVNVACTSFAARSLRRKNFLTAELLRPSGCLPLSKATISSGFQRGFSFQGRAPRGRHLRMYSFTASGVRFSWRAICSTGGRSGSEDCAQSRTNLTSLVVQFLMRSSRSQLLHELRIGSVDFHNWCKN